MYQHALRIRIVKAIVLSLNDRVAKNLSTQIMADGLAQTLWRAEIGTPRRIFLGQGRVLLHHRLDMKQAVPQRPQEQDEPNPQDDFDLVVCM